MSSKSRSMALVFMLAALPAFGQVQVFTSNAAFLAATKAEPIAFPSNAATALPDKPWGGSLTDYSCTSNTTGFLLPLGAATPLVRVTAPDAANWICFIGKDCNAGAAYFNPQPQSPTIAANGIDDYFLHFQPTIHAVGLELLTNAAATESIKLTFSDNTEAVFPKASLGTLPNKFEFVGFKSIKAIRDVTVLTKASAEQSEGITAIESASCYLVPMDVKPGSDPNSINLGSKGKIPIAVLSTPDFDATKVNLSTVEIGGAGVAVKNNGTWQASFEYVNGDQLLDLVIHVETQDLRIPSTATSLSLTANTVGGTKICGEDAIRLVPPKK